MRAFRHLKQLDWVLFAAVLALCLYGLVMVYSATRGAEAAGWAAPSQYVKKQALWLLISLFAFFLMVLFDYRSLARWHVPIYLIVMALLVVVLKVGRSPTGATSWIALGGLRLQPSELAKIAVILSIAAFVARRSESVSQMGVVGRSLAIALGPVILVLGQPDFGTALVIIAIWFGALYFAGAQGRHLALVLACGLALFAGMWNLDRIPTDRLPSPLGKVIAAARLREYQKRRLTIFLNPQADPTGAGYQVIQSRIAIGSGQLLGRGLFHSTQGRLHFIPEQRTDFIFSVVGEELGFVGCFAMLALFFFVYWRGMRIALRAKDPLGSLLAAGAVTMLAFHTVVNVGMSVNLMPITGIPLPFVSYGGSNLLASFLAFGLLQNVRMRRDSVIF